MFEYHPVLCFVLLLTWLGNVDSQRQSRASSAASSSCMTPSKNPGNCIPVKSCPLIYNSLVMKRNDSSVKEFARKHFCGHDGSIPKVCCPRSSLNNNENRSKKNNTVRPTSKAKPASVKPKPKPKVTMLSNSTISPKSILNPLSCGKTNTSITRIIGGQPAELGAWPWMAALGYVQPRDPLVYFRCGGTLITDKHVLTAAHCLHTLGNFRLAIVRLGDLNLDERVPDGAKPISVEVENVTAHPEYAAFVNDIAVIKLRNSVTFNELIRPLCLPLKPEMRSQSLDRRLFFITGWGNTDGRISSPSAALRQNQIPSVDMDICKESYYNVKHAIIDNRILCAGSEGNDTCYGDSGGPLILPMRNMYYLVGIVSFGIGCATKAYPGVYTRVSSFIDWIEKNTM